MKSYEEMSAEEFRKNADTLADGILKAIDLAEPYEWTTWDSFAGRQIYNKQPLRDAQKEMIVRFLTDVFSK